MASVLVWKVAMPFTTLLVASTVFPSKKVTVPEFTVADTPEA